MLFLKVDGGDRGEGPFQRGGFIRLGGSVCRGRIPSGLAHEDAADDEAHGGPEGGVLAQGLKTGAAGL